MKDSPLNKLLNKILDQELIQAVISSPKDKTLSQKIVVKPVLINHVKFYQFSFHIKQKVIHENLKLEEAVSKITESFNLYKQGVFNTLNADYHVLMNKKGEAKILNKKPTLKNLRVLDHNRKKNYLLDENDPIPFLIALDVMNGSGKVFADKRNKFKQINRFLEMVNDVLFHLPKDKPLKIVDFGCGKAYLTFALYHFLTVEKKLEVSMVGLDLKEEVVSYCQKVAQKLKFNHLKFQYGDINSYETEDNLDLMVCLHACDTATDAALEKAILWNTKVIMAVPCCQHELYPQIKADVLKPLLSHGILKERFAALVTDAARANLLETMGYKTQILEFIDMEHTPKNLLIRAILDKKATKIHKKSDEYLNFKNLLNIYPNLEKRIDGF